MNAGGRLESAVEGSPGIHTEVVVNSPGGCPVAAASAESGGIASNVNWTETDDGVLEEFEVDGELSGDDTSEVFQTEGGSIYRFTRDPERPCPCDAVEAVAGPVSDVYAREGQLCIAFHAAGIEDVRRAVRSLRESFDDVSVNHLLRAGLGDCPEHVLIDRGRLTERQLAVLRTAYEMGYFDYPKQANAGEVAEALDISSSTFTEHLSAAQSKLLAPFLGH